MANGIFSDFVDARIFAAKICAGLFVAISLLSLATSLSAEETRLYFFTNDGCAPCRQVEPAIEALKLEGYPITTIHAGQSPEWVRHFQVDRTPTVVLLKNKRIVSRHAGLIDAVTLKRWFSVVGVNSGERFKREDGKAISGGTKVVIGAGQNNARQNVPATFASRKKSNSTFSTPTMLKGTRKPKNLAEREAMAATVLLRVEDPKGISYATGTVIHSHQGESLVLTCGHVFRDAKGQGTITGEYGFDGETTTRGKGELIYYDADARDIGLVAIRTEKAIKPVRLASSKSQIEKGRDVFSVGCDHGEPATIRRTRIKNRAAYDGAVKYDIFGRPVDGRSGGGLFTLDGELVGVCNAAAVEVDEGIYAALGTIYWQIETVNLRHLFDESAPSTLLQQSIAARGNSDSAVGGSAGQRFASNSPFGSGTFAMAAPPKRQRSSIPRSSIPRSDEPQARITKIDSRPNSGISSRTPVSWNRQVVPPASDSEVIIIVRSKSNPAQTEAITISDPSPRLIDYLHSMQSASQAKPRELDVAYFREKFPEDYHRADKVIKRPKYSSNFGTFDFSKPK
jgi:thiol-disulfide isomerase/thioredoxin